MEQQPVKKAGTRSARVVLLGAVAILAIVCAICLRQTLFRATPSAPKAEKTVAHAFDYQKPVPEGQAVGEEYFHDAVFLGDSRTEDFLLYAGLSDTYAYAKKGLNVNTAFTKPTITVGGKTVPVMAALQSTAFTKAYLMFGINEIGWVYPEQFIRQYGAMIDAIRAINPSAVIYVQPILPVTKHHHDGDENNERIRLFNGLIRRMIAEKKVYFVNVTEAVSDADGFLPDDAAYDGVHLKKPYCEKWLRYLETHTVAQIK